MSEVSVDIDVLAWYCIYMENSYHNLTDDQLRSAWADASAQRPALRRAAQSSAKAKPAYAELLEDLAAIRAEWIARGLRG